MRIIKSIIVLSFCLLWILVTNYKSAPLNSLGALLSYKSGILGINSTEQIELGNSRNLVIKIDSFGIPYIYADEDKDVAFGLGFMHAKDRYFQMELMSNMVKGELSAMFGPRAIPSDEFWQPYEFSKKAAEILEEYKISEPALYNYIMAYGEGVNTYLNKNTINDPIYNIFDRQPQEWKPEYALMVTWYMSKNLAYFDFHAERQELVDKLPNDLLEALYPMAPKGLKTILPSQAEAKVNTKQAQPLQNIELDLSQIAPQEYNADIGSNNWAVNSQKTENGIPLVANDPHLFLTLPGPFYEVSLMGNSIKTYGYTIPGVPLVVSGHNQQIAWGITNGEWDLTDSYLLKTKEDSLYLYEGKWIPFQEEEYTIEVRGKGEEVIKVKRTLHGVVMQEEDQYFAQKWHASSKSYSVKALFSMMQSEDWSSFKDALKDYDYPPQNFIYGDVNDTIGIICAGKLPDKPSGFYGGLLDGTKAPLEDSFISTQWETSNPEQSYLFSANQLPIHNDTYFGMHWHKDDYRVSYIDSLLKSKDNWTVPAMQEMQLDETDISFFHLQKLLQEKSFDNKYNEIIMQLSAWDGDMDSDSKTAFVYETLRLNIEAEAERFAQEKLNVQEAPSMKSFVNFLMQDSLNEQAYILENILMRTDSIIEAENLAGEKNLSEKSAFFANNMSFLPGFGYAISDVGGNKNTINMNTTAHPVFRSIYEMKKGAISGQTIMAGGQSGKMNAKNYTDQLEDWKKGNYRITQFSESPEALKNIAITLTF